MSTPRNLDKRTLRDQPSRELLGDAFATFLFDRTFPNDRYPPAEPAQGFEISSIALYCLGKLGLPEWTVGRWRRREGAAGMSVPETATNLDCRTILREDDVRLSRQARDVQPISQAHAMEGAPKEDLGLCVLSSDSRHHPGSGNPVDNIDHAIFPGVCPLFIGL